MSKGQFGRATCTSILWKLSIPEFDPAQELHAAIAEAGATAQPLRGIGWMNCGGSGAIS